MCAELLDEAIVVTRKAHRCQGCGTCFPAGTKLRCQSLAADGEAWTFYFCPPCDQLYDEEQADGFDFHDICDDAYRGHIRDFDPARWNDLWYQWRFNAGIIGFQPRAEPKHSYRSFRSLRTLHSPTYSNPSIL